MIPTTRNQAFRGLVALNAASDGEVAGQLEALVTPDTQWDCCAPIEGLTGPQAVLEGLIRPLRAALPRRLRRDYCVIGGTCVRGNGAWIATYGHYVGNLDGAFLGIAATGKLVFLRYGEYYRLDNGRIAEAKILFDLPDLMRQCGGMPLPRLLGSEITFPPPATLDGVLPDAPERSAASGQLVWDMLANLHAFDPETFSSDGQTGTGGYWHEDMLWYGPCGIGSNFTYDGFQRDHRIPFLNAFPDRRGGNHFCRIADGDYVASGGWPSMTMTHRGAYLGVPATDKALTLRVMDLWRVEAGQIRENWVLLDYVHLFAAMGVDLFARYREAQAG